MGDVHTSHCCIRHGCKYGWRGSYDYNDKECTVVSGREKQEYECEYCGMEREQWVQTLQELLRNSFFSWSPAEKLQIQSILHKVRSTRLA